MGSQCLISTEFLFGKIKKFWSLRSFWMVMSVTQQCELYTLKRLEGYILRSVYFSSIKNLRPIKKIFCECSYSLASSGSRAGTGMWKAKGTTCQEVGSTDLSGGS